jgi:hypothetical protein
MRAGGRFRAEHVVECFALLRDGVNFVISSSFYLKR